MEFKGRAVALLMSVSLLIGAGGTYAGLSVLDSNEAEAPKVKTEIERDFISQNPSQSASDVEDIDKIAATLELITERYVEKVDQDELVEGAIQGMIDTLEDPYSVYMDQETAKQFSQSLDSSFEGIGAEVSMVDGKVTIVAPFKDSPAEKAGLKPNDQILKVDGESLAGLDLYEAVLKIRGEKGTVVTLEVDRPGVNDLLEIPVTRDEIPIETVYSETFEKDGKTIGVLELTSFSENTSIRFKEELAALEKQNIDGLVIDVRGNPGGYLESVEEISRLLIPKTKPFVQIENREGQKERYFSDISKKKDYPIVGLINEGSASASEILAGALKEAGGYELVGQKTFGKGTVQQPINMGDGSNIKLTLFKWLTPDGNWIHKKGVEPTVEVKQPDYFYANRIQVEEPLQFDMNNDQVKNAQTMLEGIGFDPGRTDGYFSKQTETAVKAFQDRHDLEVTGVIDEKTASAIQQKAIEAVKDPQNDLQLQTAFKLLFK